jgi:hypothetical protein
MDPAQLDRFVKIKVGDNTPEWLKYGKQAGILPEILDFIKENPKTLSSDSKDLEDEEKPTPSPRGWDMVDTLLRSEPMLRVFFTDKENEDKVVERDMRNLVSAKLGSSVATMFFSSVGNLSQAITAEEILSDDENLSNLTGAIQKLSAVKKAQTCDFMLQYLKENIEFLMLQKPKFDTVKKQLSAFIKPLDSSTRLLFAQNMAATVTDDGNNLIELLFGIFESDLLEMLDLSEKTRKLIEGGS